ncbi:tetratricopeptide repeat protein [Thermoleptolyngbya sp. C42_A2020_037]|uniref:tetratricopeptide repeat protein n=1 Tax=Thermoleptolyngbya sp. C42_A2020_037 TaxID=2747799 RepID=UPI0019FDFF5C|nr:tetratricopeptide repeat protein [Thermoleptolyngbya sp. C42_A2020_037]MBF2085795.1 tetratricopeptide repeat protein [Thermoleptolyngbya sp. C42_A2020_037]
MSDQHIHDQGTGIQVEVTGGNANVAKTIIINEPLPPPPPTGIPSNLPQYPNQSFRGREDDWAKLHDALQQTERVAITALQGMGGVGKTELALQYATAKLREGAYPGGVCWLGAREQEIGTQITQYFQAQLGLTLPDGLDDLAAQVGYCWRHWREGEVLVVVDDVAYQRVAEYEAKVKPYLPTDPRFRVVVTTRQDLGASFRRVPLGVLGEDAALDVLRDLAGASRIDGQLADAKRLCAWLGYLPLGLELVGRYLASKPDLTLAEMQRRLEQQKLAARALSCQEAMTATHESVAAAFELSWNDLTEAQRQLGERLSLFALAPIPWALVAAMQPEAEAEDLEDDCGTLANRNLLNRVGEGSYQLHSLIREFFAAKREQATDADDLTKTHCAVLVQVAKAIPWTAAQATYLALAPVVPHLVEVVNHHMQVVSDEAVPSPANGLVKFYSGQGLYAEGVRWAERCKEQVENRLGADHPSTATSLNNLAGLYESMGRYSEAEPLYGRSLAIIEAQLGADHPDTATSLNNLAGLYRAMGRYSEAEPLYLRALPILFSRLGQDHPTAQTVWQNFVGLLIAAVQAGRAGELSDHPLTQDLIQRIQAAQGQEE